MSTNIIAREAVKHQEWQAQAQEFIKLRLGVAGAKASEFIAGYIDGFKGVCVTPEKIHGESWYVWFLSEGGKAARVVNELMPGVYVDHEGNCYEHDAEMVLVLGTVSRIGQEPWLTPDMFK